MVFKLLFLLSLVLGSVFLDAIGLVEYEDEISSLDKLEWGFAERSLFYIIRAVYRSKYLKGRIMYSYSHPGSFNPAVKTNKEAHMIYGNMNKKAGSLQATGLVKKKSREFPTFFPKLNSTLLKVSLGFRCFI